MPATHNITALQSFKQTRTAALNFSLPLNQIAFTYFTMSSTYCRPGRLSKVPMYTLSPCASGHDLHDEVRAFIPGPRHPCPRGFGGGVRHAEDGGGGGHGGVNEVYLVYLKQGGLLRSPKGGG